MGALANLSGSILGSARGSRAGDRVFAIANFLVFATLAYYEPKEKFVSARTPKPAREPRALPRIALQPARFSAVDLYWRCHGCVTF